MNASEFELILEDTFMRVGAVLSAKADEYADDVDRLRNFKQAAHLQECTVRDALAGMMVKHTVSCYDLMGRATCADQAAWDEKIIDHINYLILLRALVAEELTKKGL